MSNKNIKKGIKNIEKQNLLTNEGADMLKNMRAEKQRDAFQAALDDIMNNSYTPEQIEEKLGEHKSFFGPCSRNGVMSFFIKDEKKRSILEQMLIIVRKEYVEKNDKNIRLVDAPFIGSLQESIEDISQSSYTVDEIIIKLQEYKDKFCKYDRVQIIDYFLRDEKQSTILEKMLELKSRIRKK